MKRIVTLTESDLTRIIRRVLNEGSGGTTKLNSKGQYIFASGTKAVYKNHNNNEDSWHVDKMCYGLESGNLIRCQAKNGYTLDIDCDGVKNYAIDENGESLYFVSPTQDFAKKMRSMFCCGKKLKPENLRAGSEAWKNTNCNEMTGGDKNLSSRNKYVLNGSGQYILGPTNLVVSKIDQKIYKMGGNNDNGPDGKKYNGMCYGLSKENVIRCQNKLNYFFDIDCADTKNHALDKDKKSLTFIRETSDFADKMRKMFCCGGKVKPDNLRPGSTPEKSNCPSTNKSKTIKINPSEEEKCTLEGDSTWSYATKDDRWYASKDGKNWIDITNNSKAVKILTDPVKGCKNLKDVISFVPPPAVDFGSSDIPLPKD